MADAVTEALIKRADKARQTRDAFASLMRDVYAYAMPERDAWTGFGYGQDKTTKVFDSTATVATARFANRLQQALFPPQQRFARLSLPPELAAVPDAEEIQQDLERATTKLFAHIHVSNFDLAANEFAQDLAAGTACLLIENGRLRRSRAPLLRFQAIPSAKVGFDEGPYGQVEGIFFDQEIEARLVARTYPDATLPREIQSMAADDPTQIVHLLQATTYDAEADDWRMDVIVTASKEKLVTRRYRTSPWVVTRWSKAPGESHGRGPLTQALPDIRTLNKLVELLLKKGSFDVAPVLLAMDDGVLNPATISLVPGSVIPVRSPQSLSPLKMGGDLQLTELLRAQLQTAVRQVLFDDPLPPEVQAGITATEVTERVRRFQQDTGAFGRLQSDAVAPIILRCIDILDAAGEFAGEEYADLLNALRSDAIRIRAASPMSQAQDLADVQAVMQFIAGAASLGELGAQMIRSGIDPVKAGRYVAERAGVPHTLIPTTAELQRQAQEAAETAQEQQLLSSPAVAQVLGQVARGAVDQGAAAPEPVA